MREAVLGKAFICQRYEYRSHTVRLLQHPYQRPEFRRLHQPLFKQFLHYRAFWDKQRLQMHPAVNYACCL